MKKEEILRKRNLQLVQEIEELKIELEQQKEANSSLQTEVLIEHIENIKNALFSSIDEIDELRTEYKALIEEVKEYFNILKGN